MPTTRATIAKWLDRLYDDESLTHMVVRVDWFDHEDYPQYISKDGDVLAEVNRATDDRVMEVYSRNHDRDAQLAEYRAFHYD